MIIIACAFVLGTSRMGSGDRGSGIGSRIGIGIRIRDQRITGRPVGRRGLAAAPRLVMFARRIFIDIWITAFMSLTLMFFALSERYPERRRLFLC